MRWLFLFIFYFSIHISKAQQEVSYANEVWWGVMTSVQVSERWAIWNDSHFVNDLFFIFRSGLTYHPKKSNFNATVGYGYLTLAAPFSEGRLIRSEHRPWMQTVYNIPSNSRLSNSLRFRFDVRFIENLEVDRIGEGFSYNHRWRFNHSLRYNWEDLIFKETRFFTTILNEALFNGGPGPNGVRHEHRTFFLGQLNKGNFTYSLGYVVRYINVSPTLARINHGPVFWLSINLNFMKGKLPTATEFPSDHIY